MLWCYSFFTLPQMFAPVCCQRDQFWAGQISVFMGDHSYASVLWYNLSSPPLEKCWLSERLAEIWFWFLILDISEFLHKLLWLTGKRKREECGIWLLKWPKCHCAEQISGRSVYGFFLDKPCKFFLLQSCSKLQSNI